MIVKFIAGSLGNRISKADWDWTKRKKKSPKDREPMAEIFGFLFCGKDELFNVSICNVYVVSGGENVVFTIVI